MLVRTLVKQFFDNHLTAYHIKGSVNQPNEYIWKNLTTLKANEQYDAKRHSEIVDSIKTEKEIINIILRDAPHFDPTSKTTRNAVNIFYQFILLFQMKDDEKVDLAQAIAKLGEAEQLISASKSVIQAHVLTTQSISRNPLNMIKVWRSLDTNPFKDFFTLVESQFRDLKLAVLSAKQMPLAEAAVVKKVDGPKDTKMPVSTTEDAMNLFDQIEKLKAQLAQANLENAKLKKELSETIETSIKSLKEISEERIKVMANIDKDLQVCKTQFDEKFRQVLDKLQTAQAAHAKGVPSGKDAKGTNLHAERLEENIKCLKNFKSKIEDFWFLYKDFFQRKLFAMQPGQDLLPNYNDRMNKLKEAQTLPKTVYYQRMLNSNAIPEGTPEYFADLFFTKIEELLAFLKPNAEGNCELKRYHHKLGSFDSVYWQSLTMANQALRNENPHTRAVAGMLITAFPANVFQQGFYGSATKPGQLQLDPSGTDAKINVKVARVVPGRGVS